MARGTAQLKGALARKRADLLAGVGRAVQEQMDDTVATAQRFVREDKGTLKAVITAQSTGEMSGTVAPRPELAKDDTPRNVAIEARVNEFGRKRDKGKPYMTPAAANAKRSFPKRVEAAARKALQ